MESESEAGPTYDYSQWPLLVIRMPPHRLSTAAFQAHLVSCGEPFRRKQPFTLLIHMGEHPPLPAMQRKAVSEAMKADNQRYAGLQRGLAIVVRSSLERGIITAISWMARPPYPFAAFGTEAKAKHWLLKVAALGAAPDQSAAG